MHKKVLQNQLTGFLYFPFGILLAFIAFKYPQYAMLYGVGAGGCLLLLLALLVMPVGRMRFGEQASPLLPWLLKVIFFQVVMVLLFIGGIITFYGAGPGFSNLNLSVEAFTLAVKNHQWLLWTFSPWSGLMIWVICLGYYYHVRKVGPYPAQATCETLKGFIEPRLKAFIETSIYSVNTMALSITMAMSVLLASYAVQVAYELTPHTIVAPFTFTLIGFVTIILAWRVNRKRLAILHKKGLSFPGWMFITFILLFFCLVVSSILMGWLFLRAEFDPLSVACGNCTKFFDSATTDERMAAYYWGWGLVWIPLAGSYLVKISKGRSIREIILGISFFPLILMLMFYVYPDVVPNIFRSFASSDIASDLTYRIILLVSFSLIAFLFCFIIARNVHNSSLFQRGVLEDLETDKAGRIRLRDGAKLVGFSRLCLPFFLAVITILFVHMLGGWYLIQLNLVVLAPVMMHHLYTATAIICHQFKQKGLWRAPEKACAMDSA